MSRPVLGIVGAGQLARMTAQAASRLAVETHVFAASSDDAATEVATRTTVGDIDSLAELESFAGECDVVTFDHELVDLATVATLERRGHVVRPGAAVLRYTDKAVQREAFAAAGIPVPDHAVVTDDAALVEAAERLGWPLVAKPARGGYDGKGVHVIDDLEAARALLDAAGTVVVEELLELERELSVVVARRPSGASAVYPVVETVQRDGICHELFAPAGVPVDLADAATDLARTVVDHVEGVGIVAVELFVAGGRLLVNEIAVRPHNSGHHTIDGATTSQFENHLRAVLDWPLGDTALTAPAVAMVNVLGPPDGSDPRERVAEALTVPAAHVHLYGKQSRPGRKLGHVTVAAADLPTALGRAREAAAALTGEGGAAGAERGAR